MDKSLKFKQWRFLVIWQIFITIFASPAFGMNPEDLKKLSYQLKNSKLTGHSSSSSSSSSSMPLGSADRIGKMEKQEEPGRTIQLGAKGGSLPASLEAFKRSQTKGKELPQSLLNIVQNKMNTMQRNDFAGMTRTDQLDFHNLLKQNPVQPELPSSLQKFVQNKMNTEERADFQGMSRTGQLAFHSAVKKAQPKKELPQSLMKFVDNKMNTVERSDFQGMSQTGQLAFHEAVKQKQQLPESLHRMVKNSSGLGGKGSNNNFPNLMNSQGWTSSGTMTSQLNQRGVQRMLMRVFNVQEVAALIMAIGQFFRELVENGEVQPKQIGQHLEAHEIRLMFNGKNRGLVIQIIQGALVPTADGQGQVRVCSDMQRIIYQLVRQVELSIPENGDNWSEIRSAMCSWALSQFLLNVLQGLGESGRTQLGQLTRMDMKDYIDKAVGVFDQVKSNSTQQQNLVIAQTQNLIKETLSNNGQRPIIIGASNML